MLEFKLPPVGENVKAGNVVKIHVKVGDTIKKDQDLLELETDKATIPIPSSVNGTIKEILVKVGQDVKIGTAVMIIDEGGSPAGAQPAAKSAPAAASKASTTVSDTTTLKKPESPVVAATASAPVASSPQKDVAAAPSVRRFARELGVDIGLVPGTGPSGRISMKDVQAYVKSIMSSGASAGGSALPSKPLPDFSKFGTIDRQPMSKIRKVTSDHMTHCWLTVPHVTQFDKADITELENLRKKYSRPDRKLTITPFLMKVMAAALKNFPQFNASLDPQKEEIIYKKYINIGVAVDTEFGLIVPVIRDVDKKSILELNTELNTIAEKARAKRIMPDDLQGGSMTLTNLGGIGGSAFTPIVNWPEVCILGVARGAMEPVYMNGQFVPRNRLPLCLSYDHRAIDGADGARFLRWIAEAVEQPFMMELS